MTITEMRPFIFLIGFTLLYLLQKLIPVFKMKDHARIIHNWYVFVLSILILRVFFPSGIGANGIINFGYTSGLNSLSFGVDLVATLFIFDFAIYIQHRATHYFNFLWRFHKVHHSDKEMDTTSALRFHPIEILLSALYKTLLLIIFRPRLETFIIYEITLNTFALFNHSNLHIPKKLDIILRSIFVTPAMHYPHHSLDNQTMNKNFGNILSLWDKIFKTYTNEDNKDFGIKEYQRKLTVKDVLFMPFK